MSEVDGDNGSSLKFSGQFREEGLANECAPLTTTVVPKIRPISGALEYLILTLQRFEN
jgi:hypothetical protein